MVPNLYSSKWFLLMTAYVDLQFSVDLHFNILFRPIFKPLRWLHKTYSAIRTYWFIKLVSQVLEKRLLRKIRVPDQPSERLFLTKRPRELIKKKWKKKTKKKRSSYPLHLYTSLILLN